MNGLYRALHLPPRRLWKTLQGEKEIRTLAVRQIPADQPLPALGEGSFVPLPFDGRTCYADPVLCSRQGSRYLFCQAVDLSDGVGRIAVLPLSDQGSFGTPRVVLSGPASLGFPTVFDWNGETWMLPASAGPDLTLYRCTGFPDQWQEAARFAVGVALHCPVVFASTADAVTLLGSEIRPDRPLVCRYRRFTLRRARPAGELGTGDEVSGGAFVLEPDEPFNLQHREYGPGFCNAGALFSLGGQTIHPTRVSSRVDPGVYLQFFARRGASEVPLSAAEPHLLHLKGLDARDVVGVDSYCRDDRLELIGLRYLARLPAAPAPSAESAADGPHAG